jgi:uncharacterized protein (DUF39 family)
MAKTIAEINEKIRKGKAVVVTAEEVIDIAKEKGVGRAAEEIDVVTTGTFSPMCGVWCLFQYRTLQAEDKTWRRQGLP